MGAKRSVDAMESGVIRNGVSCDAVNGPLCNPSILSHSYDHDPSSASTASLNKSVLLRGMDEVILSLLQGYLHASSPTRRTASTHQDNWSALNLDTLIAIRWDDTFNITITISSVLLILFRIT